MTTESALFPAPDGAGVIPGLPEVFYRSGPTSQVIDGIPAWFVFHGDDCDYNDLYVHTHREDRALEIAAQMAAEVDADGEPRITGSGWCRLVTECGCTPEQHGGHVDLDAGCDEVCKHPELPPCNSDPIHTWMVEEVDGDTPGALPYLRVVLT